MSQAGRAAQGQEDPTGGPGAPSSPQARLANGRFAPGYYDEHGAWVFEDLSPEAVAAARTEARERHLDHFVSGVGRPPRDRCLGEKVAMRLEALTSNRTEILVRLANDPDWRVRYFVASNPQASQPIIDLLSSRADSSSPARRALFDQIRRSTMRSRLDRPVLDPLARLDQLNELIEPVPA